MNKISNILSTILFIMLMLMFSSCSSSSEMSAAKSGAQLWGENCLRCHNTPSPETFSDVQWDVAVMHMRIRANLTEDEAVKIVEFLKRAN